MGRLAAKWNEVVELTVAFTRWSLNMCKVTLNNNEEYVSCPSASCNFGALIEPRNNIFNCVECRAQYCIACNVPMHKGEPCAQYRERAREEKERERAEEQARRHEIDNDESQKTVQATTKGCPECGVRLQKSQGCDHFTCEFHYSDIDPE